MLCPLVGLFLLAAGAGALNQYMEREEDAQMLRTRFRPLPMGQIQPREALALSFVLCAIGFALLWMESNPYASLLGILGVVWYNGIYTPAKQRTVWATLPGAVVGAIPPIVGWTAAGGSPTDRAILAVAFFFFLWQIPHSFLLMLCYREDYFFDSLPLEKWAKITWIMIFVTVFYSFFLFYLFLSILFSLVLGIFAIVLLFSTLSSLPSPSKKESQRIFRIINLYALVFTVFLILEKIL